MLPTAKALYGKGTMIHSFYEHGGIRMGWVDAETTETKEGDLQGLAQLKKLLRLD
jgi:hypothetical protein